VSQEAWVLVDLGGDVLWGSNGDRSTKQIVADFHWYTSARAEKPEGGTIAEFERQGYTFERVVPIPEGCKVCRYQGKVFAAKAMEKWEPV